MDAQESYAETYPEIRDTLKATLEVPGTCGKLKCIPTRDFLPHLIAFNEQIMAMILMLKYKNDGDRFALGFELKVHPVGRYRSESYRRGGRR